jgi:hypothetical protein
MHNIHQTNVLFPPLNFLKSKKKSIWIPAFAGMTVWWHLMRGNDGVVGLQVRE